MRNEEKSERGMGWYIFLILAILLLAGPLFIGGYIMIVALAIFFLAAAVTGLAVIVTNGLIKWALAPSPVTTAATTPEGVPAMRTEREPRRMPRFGLLEVVIVVIGAILLMVETAAIFMGIGAEAAIVTLGYFLAVGAAYLLYKGSRQDARFAAEQQATTRVWASPTPITAPVADDYAIARSADLFRNLTLEQIDRVMRIARWEFIPAGMMLCEAGTPGKDVFIIVAGQIELTGSSGLGAVTVRVAGPGESLPLSAILGDGELVTSAETMSDVEVFAIRRDELLSLCRADTDIGLRIFSTVAELIASRYRVTLRRHLAGIGDVMRQPDAWANI